ncbi:DUF2231 domain-containing protein [Thermopolyspora sp. NPDC052614]|uniref:DUF2231 domain-containing protein n=1 Tax=Thermopolyspora sp. NPDC052614 TaxID=3155682 RepID=UPI00342145D1
MFEILGLPAHPLIIHAAVVFIPLLAIVSVGYAVLPGWRARLGWAVVALGIAGPLSAIAARASGLALVDELFGGEYPEGVLGQRVEEHAGLATPLTIVAVALGVVALLLVYFARRAGSAAQEPAGGAGQRATAVKTSAGNTTVTMVLSVVTIVLALAALYFVVRTGHSGATAVWGK